jgi:hypothetical protein
MMAEERRPTSEEVMAEVRAVADRIRSLRDEQEWFRREWPENMLLATRLHVMDLYLQIGGRSSMDASGFRAVYETCAAFLAFLDEERKYVEASAGDAENPPAQPRS